MSAPGYHCLACGREIPADAKFCPYCGKSASDTLAGFVRDGLNKNDPMKPPRELTKRGKIGCLSLFVLVPILIVGAILANSGGPQPTPEGVPSTPTAPPASTDSGATNPPSSSKSSTNQEQATLDWTKPLFTKKGAALCLSKEGIKNLEEHVAAGVTTYYSDYQCVPADDGTTVKLLETGGFMSFVDKVAVIHDDGTSSDAWVSEGMLRN